jgi:hypothetical protein
MVVRVQKVYSIDPKDINQTIAQVESQGGVYRNSYPGNNNSTTIYFEYPNNGIPGFVPMTNSYGGKHNKKSRKTGGKRNKTRKSRR